MPTREELTPNALKMLRRIANGNDPTTGPEVSSARALERRGLITLRDEGVFRGELENERWSAELTSAGEAVLNPPAPAQVETARADVRGSGLGEQHRTALRDAAPPSSVVEEARERLRLALTHMRMAVEMAEIEIPGSKAELAIVAKKPGGSGRLTATFEARAFFDDIASLVGEDEDEATDTNTSKEGGRG